MTVQIITEVSKGLFDAVITCDTTGKSYNDYVTEEFLNEPYVDVI